MKKHKLFLLLRSFSTDEMDKFGDFIRSPYFNHNKTVITFIDSVKIFYPDFENKP